MLLTLCIFVPLAGALALAAVPAIPERLARILGTAIAAVPLAALAIALAGFDPGGPQFQYVTDAPWIPSIGAGYRLGVDGIALAVAVTSAVLFTVATAYPTDLRGRGRQYVAWMLFLEATSLGLFLTLDLLLFYVCFDLSLVGMYFLVAQWGHEDRERAALKFLLFTLLGSFVMLLGILSLVLATDPVTFDMRVLIAEQPLAGTGARAGLTLLALLFGMAVKTPLVPVHTWLPAAHVEAPAPGSAILAGVLLKMGTYGMIRVAWGAASDAFTRYAPVVASVAVVSIVYGALVALGQRHIKRRIAYTSITHMGYTVLGIAVAAALGPEHDEARRMALGGATLEMVAHGLITGTLFLLAGSLHDRAQSFSMDDFGGVAPRAPLLLLAFGAASFASLGLPGFAGFVAEVQIFSGTVALDAWLAGAALLGALITAALFLQMLQAIFLGKPGGRTPRVTDLRRVELAGVALLMVLTLVLGVVPGFATEVIDAGARAMLGAQR